MKNLNEETHKENLISNFNFNEQEGYYKNLKEKEMGAKIYFNDKTSIEGHIIKSDRFNFYLMHKNNILMVLKSNVKFIEPLPPLKK